MNYIENNRKLRNKAIIYLSFLDWENNISGVKNKLQALSKENRILYIYITNDNYLKKKTILTTRKINNTKILLLYLCNLIPNRLLSLKEINNKLKIILFKIALSLINQDRIFWFANLQIIDTIDLDITKENKLIFDTLDYLKVNNKKDFNEKKLISNKHTPIYYKNNHQWQLRIVNWNSNIHTRLSRTIELLNKAH